MIPMKPRTPPTAVSRYSRSCASFASTCFL